MDVKAEASERLEAYEPVKEKAYSVANSLFLRSFGMLVVGVMMLIALNSSCFSIRQVIIRGNHHVSKEAIVMAACLPPEPALFLMDYPQICKNIATHPRIAKVRVWARYPDRLVIAIVERRPICWIKQGPNVYLLGDDLIPMKIPDTGYSAVLPEITGLGKIKLKLGVMLAEPKMKNVKQLTSYSPQVLGGWVRQIDLKGSWIKIEQIGRRNSIVVNLGNFRQVPEKMNQLRAILTSPPAGEIIGIDLRMPGFSTVKVVEKGLAEKKN